MKAKETLKKNIHRCGNCGESKHELFGFEDSIIVVCSSCDNESKISASTPKLEIEWVEGSDGRLCIF